MRLEFEMQWNVTLSLDQRLSLNQRFEHPRLHLGLFDPLLQVLSEFGSELPDFDMFWKDELLMRAQLLENIELPASDLDKVE